MYLDLKIVFLSGLPGINVVVRLAYVSRISASWIAQEASDESTWLHEGTPLAAWTSANVLFKAPFNVTVDKLYLDVYMADSINYFALLT